MIINDGYNLTTEYKGRRLIYRPLTCSVRSELATLMSEMQDEEVESVMRATIMEQVVGEGSTLQLDKMGHDEQVLFRAVCGVGIDEKADEWNLRSGVRLLILYPGLASLTCDSCRDWWYYLRGGEVCLASRNGTPQPRPKDTLPCEVAKCPVGHHSRQRRLSLKNLAAYRHNRACSAVGSFPDDAIVHRNARIIEWAIEKADVDRRRAVSR